MYRPTIDRILFLEAFVWCKKAPAEGVEDVGVGKSGFGVTDVMGELDISGGAVFVVARDGSHIHAYLNSVYFCYLQENSYILHASAF
jgi:hypothetical protein